MLRLLFILVLLGNTYKVCFAQNLVPNPSFEEFPLCPNVVNQFSSVTNWINPTASSPDYYNACDTVNGFGVPYNTHGYMEAKSGVAYAGGFVFSRFEVGLRDYIQVKLIKQLYISERKNYYVGFYCSLISNYCRLAVNNLGAFFSKDAVSRNDMLTIDTIPQLVNKPINSLTSRTEWMLVADTIQFNEDSLQYMTIGNFFPDPMTDTISVMDSIGFAYQSYYLFDDVFVIDLDSLTSIGELKPLTGKAFIHGGQLLIELEESYKPLEIILTNCAGQIVWQHKGFYTQGQKEYNLPLLSEGLYFVEIRCGGGLLREKVLIYE